MAFLHTAVPAPCRTWLRVYSGSKMSSCIHSTYSATAPLTCVLRQQHVRIGHVLGRGRNLRRLRIVTARQVRKPVPPSLIYIQTVQYNTYRRLPTRMEALEHSRPDGPTRLPDDMHISDRQLDTQLAGQSDPAFFRGLDGLPFFFSITLFFSRSPFSACCSIVARPLASIDGTTIRQGVETGYTPCVYKSTAAPSPIHRPRSLRY
jgi:hypothetical protein